MLPEKQLRIKDAKLSIAEQRWATLSNAEPHWATLSNAEQCWATLKEVKTYQKCHIGPSVSLEKKAIDLLKYLLLYIFQGTALPITMIYAIDTPSKLFNYWGIIEYMNMYYNRVYIYE